MYTTGSLCSWTRAERNKGSLGRCGSEGKYVCSESAISIKPLSPTSFHQFCLLFFLRKQVQSGISNAMTRAPKNAAIPDLSNNTPHNDIKWTPICTTPNAKCTCGRWHARQTHWYSRSSTDWKKERNNRVIPSYWKSLLRCRTVNQMKCSLYRGAFWRLKGLSLETFV